MRQLSHRPRSAEPPRTSSEQRLNAEDPAVHGTSDGSRRCTHGGSSYRASGGSCSCNLPARCTSLASLLRSSCSDIPIGESTSSSSSTLSRPVTRTPASGALRALCVATTGTGYFGGGDSASSGVVRSVTDDAAVDCDALRTCAPRRASKSGDTGVPGSLADPPASASTSSTSSVTIADRGRRAGADIGVGIGGWRAWCGYAVCGTGGSGRTGRAPHALSGVSGDGVDGMERALPALCGGSGSRGAKTKLICVRSHSAVNVSAEPGADAGGGRCVGGERCVGGARYDEEEGGETSGAPAPASGSGDGGSTSCTPFESPRRRIFLMLSGAVFAKG